MIEKFRDECGIFGIFGHKEAANITYLGLHGLQHRGQESAGIVSSDGESLHVHKQMGYVVDAFNKQNLEKLWGNIAIGHVRYSTAGESSIKNAQPFAFKYSKGAIAIAHNGNLTNALSLRNSLENEGSIFHSNSDSEVIIHLIARGKGNNLVLRIIDALYRIRGAYSLLLLSENEMFAIRDPLGIRPLVMGELNDSIVFSSETCAFDLVGAKYIREVEAGEIVIVNEEGISSKYFSQGKEPKRCIFEHIYFSRPDSIIFGKNVYEMRKSLGKELAKEHPVHNADVVVPVPDSGVGAAIGYAMELNVSYEMGMIRNHYVGRTFIEPEYRIRHFGVKLKLNAVDNVVRNKVVVIVDDSLVRGTTSMKIVQMIRSHGAKEVHLRISSPPTKYSCFYGIDTPTCEELIAHRKTIDEIRDFITADSVSYLSVEGMHRAINSQNYGYCDACFTGNYPISLEDISYENKQISLFES